MVGAMCGDGSIRPRPVTVEELAHLNVGERFTAPGCCPDTVNSLSKCQSKKFSWPNNGEFDWGGKGNNCQMCSNVQYGYGCEARGCWSIRGVKPTIVRKSYNADRLACCLGKGKIIDGKTCNPNAMTPNSSPCRDVMLSYCSQGDRYFTDSNCKAFIGDPTNKQVALARMREIANDINVLKKNEWAVNFCVDNPGFCDSGMASFCASNTGDIRCACINSKASGVIDGVTFNPTCVDEKCIKNNTYKSATMTKACNINLLQCNQYNTLINRGVSVSSGMKPTQNCSINVGGDDGGSGGGGVIAPKEGTNGGEEKDDSGYMIYIIIFIFVIIIGLLIVGYTMGIFDDDDNNITGGFIDLLLNN